MIDERFCCQCGTPKQHGLICFLASKVGYSRLRDAVSDCFHVSKIDFWAFVKENDEGKEVAKIVKTYQPREVWDGRRYSGKTRTVYTTLGSIKDFIEKQKGPNARGQCTECGEYGPLGETCRECHEGTHV